MIYSLSCYKSIEICSFIMEGKLIIMSDAVLITIIICSTLIINKLIGSDNNGKNHKN